MDIYKVNSILSKALVQIQEGEAETLRNLVISEADSVEEPTEFERIVGDLADRVVAECKVAEEDAIDAIIEVAGSMAEQGSLPELFGLENPTDKDVDEWLNAVSNSNFIESTLEHLAA